MRHFGTVNKNTILNKTFSSKSGDKSDTYLRLPLFPQNTRNADVVKMKRKFVMNYDSLGWAKKAVTDYNRLMQGLLDSYMCFRDSSLSRGTVEVTIGFVEQLRRIFPSSEINILEFPSLPQFMRPRGDASSSDASFFSRDNISFIKLDLTNAGASGSSSILLDMIGRYRVSGSDSRVYSFVISRKTFPGASWNHFRIFDFDHTMTGYNSPLPTAAVTSSERYLQRLESSADFDSIEYIVTELPEDYDAAYNRQSWLALTDRTTKELCLDAHNTIFVKYSHLVWEVSGFESSHTHSGALESISTNFIGSWNGEEVKNDLSSYVFTTDESFLGKGRIYVDADGVCYCPVSGYPLKCVYSNYDYEPIETASF